jgi:DNA-binding response OmpR family regulator
MGETTILIVEDEPSIAEIVQLYLKRAGYATYITRDGEGAQDWLEHQSPDLVILDLMLPKLDGYSVARWLRTRSDVPIIMLTARRDELDRIAGLEMGADDYVLKPFSPQELVSRVRAVLRRSQSQNVTYNQKPVEYPGLRIDPQSRQVFVRGKEVGLTAKEFDLLWLFCLHPRQVFNRDQLLDRVWGISDYLDPSTVTVHIRRLREKIENDPSNPTYIITVWGVGYKFEPS